MSSRHDTRWDGVYHNYRPECLPWELGKPRKVLKELVESGQVVPGKTLDLCCGAGTNPVYLAKKGFEVTALDISDKAVEYTKEKASTNGVNLSLVVGSFLSLPFVSEEFDFVFDFGCFHHVEAERRTVFIEGVHRVLKVNGVYFLVCFSEKNGSAWNHFTKEKIIVMFQKHFKILNIKHVSSLEGDNVTRYFYEVFMKRNDSIK